MVSDLETRGNSYYTHIAILLLLQIPPSPAVSRMLWLTEPFFPFSKPTFSLSALISRLLGRYPRGPSTSTAAALRGGGKPLSGIEEAATTACAAALRAPTAPPTDPARNSGGAGDQGGNGKHSPPQAAV